MSRGRRRAFAVAALSFYAIHAGHHIWHGHWEDALWVCHLANLILAAGFVFAWQRTVGVALMWLIVGNAMWVFYLLDGGDFTPSSLLTHVGGLLLAIAGCAEGGISPGTWAVATTGLVAAQILARLLTSAEANVNVAWRVSGNWGTWTHLFPNYPTYIVLVDGAAAVLFWTIETAWRALLGKRRGGIAR